MSPRVSERHREARRQQIMAAAEVVFCQKGFQAAVIEDIIQASGMSRGGVYGHFASKTEMFLALLEARDKAIAEDLSRLHGGGMSCWDSLMGILEALEQRLYQMRDGMDAVFVEYFIARWRDPAQRQFLETRFARNLAPFVALLQEGVARGEFHPQKPGEQIALYLASHWDGLMLGTMLVGPDAVAASAQITQVRHCLAQMLGLAEAAEEASNA